MRLRFRPHLFANRGVASIIFVASIPSLVVIVVAFCVYGWLHGMQASAWGSMAAIALALSLQGLLLFMFLSARAEQWIKTSFRDLSETAHAMLGFEASTCESESSEECLAKIQMAFTSLLDQADAHERELAALHEDTDRRVKTRTLHLIRAREAAEEATRLKSQFLANVSHELRTPMHAILSFSRFGMERMGRTDRAKLLEYFERINVSGERLLALLDDLLNLAKLEAGKTTYSFQSEDLLQVVQATVAEFQCLATEKMCAVNLTEGVPANVQMDRKRMMQVIRNILGNAIKFSPYGGTVHVRVRKVDGAATVEVRDEGVGIPEEDLDGIFENFVQARNISSDAGGTGLGLAISREIVKAHNGDIWVYNNRESGAVFVFSVPLYVPNSSSRELQSEHIPSGVGTSPADASMSRSKNVDHVSTLGSPS